MRNAIITTVGLLATGSVAIPSWWNGQGLHGGVNCMNDAQAYVVANNFRDLIAAYTNATADAVLTPNVVDYSDSVIELMDGGCNGGVPAGNPFPYTALGSATFDSRAAFEAGQGGQPNITFNILNVWHNCDTVTLRWRSPTPNPGPEPTPPASQEQVTGIVVLETTFNGWSSAQPFLINTIFSEFNSGAWLYDLDVFKPESCTTASKARIRRSLPAYMARGIDS